jgi:hypothetical protein
MYVPGIVLILLTILFWKDISKRIDSLPMWAVIVGLIALCFYDPSVILFVVGMAAVVGILGGIVWLHNKKPAASTPGRTAAVLGVVALIVVGVIVGVQAHNGAFHNEDAPTLAVQTTGPDAGLPQGMTLTKPDVLIDQANAADRAAASARVKQEGAVCVPDCASDPNSHGHPDPQQ